MSSFKIKDMIEPRVVSAQNMLDLDRISLDEKGSAEDDSFLPFYEEMLRKMIESDARPRLRVESKEKVRVGHSDVYRLLG